MAALVAASCAVVLLAACASVLEGNPIGPAVPNATLAVRGDSHSPFDSQVKNAISDVTAFWRSAYPSAAQGVAFPELTGKLYSVDGLQVLHTDAAPASAAGEQCMAQKLTFIIDNAAYCELDDSIVWDRSPDHLLPVLARTYGNAVIAMVFAHEIGHAVQKRLGIADQNLPTIDLESQADCAAGAFLASALAGKAPHFRLTATALDEALTGFLQIRDMTPESPKDISHGNGFDRLSAVDDGITHGVTYCFGNSYFTRTFTERGYVSDKDYVSGGNQSVAQLLNPDDLAKDLNRFWTDAGQTIKETFAPVRLAQAAHPACGSARPASQLGYCPDDNTVYYSNSFAQQAYYSITERRIDPSNGNVTLVPNQAGDFALGMLVSISWGMAARHQFFHRSVLDRAGLLAAICYAGAYAHDVNRATSDATHPYILSPPDMDEATSAVLTLVGLDQAFGARDTSGLQRIQSFVTGYGSGLSSCE
jgi:predicted metalloprotease